MKTKTKKTAVKEKLDPKVQALVDAAKAQLARCPFSRAKPGVCVVCQPLADAVKAFEVSR